jgi:hypothetical protein
VVTPRESIPYLGGDEQVFSIDDAVSEDFLQSNTNLGWGHEKKIYRFAPTETPQGIVKTGLGI